jgi:hypothetical protein
MDKGFWMTLLAMLAILAAAGGVMWFGAGVEASTYNRMNGTDITQWEAVWTRLMVDCRR